MNVNKPVSRRTLTSNLEQIDTHDIALHEYEELPELTEDMLAERWLCSASRLQRWRVEGQGIPYLLNCNAK